MQQSFFSTVGTLISLDAAQLVDRLLADFELRYPYLDAKTLMYVFDRFEDAALVLELLNGMYTELPEKKPVKSR